MVIYSHTRPFTRYSVFLFNTNRISKLSSLETLWCQLVVQCLSAIIPPNYEIELIVLRRGFVKIREDM